MELETEGSDNLNKEVKYHYDYSVSYRYIMMGIALLMAFLTGPSFMNWKPLNSILSSTDIYIDLCPPGSPTQYGKPTCGDREVALEAIGSFTSVINFGSTLFAGLFLDSLGPKICSCIGLVLQLIGWLIVGISFSLSFNGYHAGYFFLAAGADPTFFGLLSISNLFPGHSSTMVASLGAARSASFSIPLLLKLLWFNAQLSFSMLCFFFVFLIALWLAWVIFFIPFRCFPKATQWIEEDTKTSVSLKENVSKMSQLSLAKMRKAAVVDGKECFDLICTLSYALLALLACIALLTFNYYRATNILHLSHSEALFEIMAPLSFIPCPFLGFIADKVSASLALFIIQFCGISMISIGLIAATLNSKAAEIISILTFTVFMSFTASQFYVYVFAVYPQRQAGKLVGIALLLAGALSYTSVFFHEFALKNLIAADIIIIVFEVLACCIAATLYYKMERPLQSKAARDPSYQCASNSDIII